jgi:hypothetical protein
MSQIEDDIFMMVGGHFNPASVGPESFNQVVERIRSQSDEYLDTFETLFLGPKFDALTQSRLHLPSFLRRLADEAPDRVQAIATRLLNQYNAVLVIYDDATDKNALYQLLPEESVNLFHRLDDHRRELRDLIKKE